MSPPEQHGLPSALTPGHPLQGLGYGEPVQERPVVRLTGHEASPDRAAVAEEVPVAFVYNGRPHVVMMATPADLEDFAVGFTLTEGIVGSRGSIRDVAVTRHAQGIEVQLTIPEPAGDALVQRGRALIGRTGCGLCGVDSIQDAMREPPPVPPGPHFDPTALWRAERELRPRQPWNSATGSLHAAAWADADGTIVLVREDVGRHNALDKVIGALTSAGDDFSGGFLLVTSRASYELVQKAATVGVRLLAAVSRPTGLAIRMAEATGLTLVALLRGESANVYAHPARVAEAPRTRPGP